MKRYGLIGKNISYSFSEKYFANKFIQENIHDSDYDIFDFNEIAEVNTLFNIRELKGFNVTIPYKKEIIDFLDELDAEAEEIGAVNCVKIRNGRKIGYNTDAYGFEESLKPLLNSENNRALILGDGGAALAVKFVLNKLNIPFRSVTRKGELIYKDLTEKHISENNIIINCTPLGTFPNLEEKPNIPYEFIGKKHLLFDLIYNPEVTEFLKLGLKKGAKIKNGYEMLVFQAEKSWEIWNDPL